MNLTKTLFVKIVTVGSRVFVTSFQIAGVQGKVVDSPEKAYDEIKQLTADPSVGLILVSDDMSNPITDKLTSLRAEKSTPLVFSLPSPGSKKGVDYTMMLKKILGV
jgi:V/A-type H+-transporting ATPase subunit F